MNEKLAQLIMENHDLRIVVCGNTHAFNQYWYDWCAEIKDCRIDYVLFDEEPEKWRIWSDECLQHKEDNKNENWEKAIVVDVEPLEYARRKKNDE